MSGTDTQGIAMDRANARPPANPALSLAPSPGGGGWTVMLRRYGMAILAPASVAAAQFIVQLVLLHQLAPEEFGLFAFLMVFVQLGFGLSNALVSTPYTVVLHQPGAVKAGCSFFFTVNGLYAVIFGLLCAGLAAAFDRGVWIAVFAAYGAAAMLRWFGRAHAYAGLHPVNAAISDIVYAGSLLAFIGILMLAGHLEMVWVAAMLLCSTILGLLTIGGGFLAAQFGPAVISSPLPYGKVWREQSRWTLLGVATTEATSNTHAYLVTAFAGPAAFAPLAAAALFLKPVALAITSLTQLERPVMSKAIASGDVGTAESTRNAFAAILLAAWAGVVALAIAVLWLRPELMLRPGYDLHDLRLSIGLFSVIVLIQVWQAPNSVFLQAAKEFRVLAASSLYACVLSIALVAAAIWIAGPVYSLAGIILGQAVMAVQISRHLSKWRKQNEHRRHRHSDIPQAPWPAGSPPVACRTADSP